MVFLFFRIHFYELVLECEEWGTSSHSAYGFDFDFSVIMWVNSCCCKTFLQGKYGGCISDTYNANERTWDLSCSANRRMLFLLHESKQCLHRHCCQQQCQCCLCVQVCCWGSEKFFLSCFIRGNKLLFISRPMTDFTLFFSYYRLLHCSNLILVGLLMKMQSAIILFLFTSY